MAKGYCPDAVAITLAELLEQYRAQACDMEKLPIVDAYSLR